MRPASDRADLVAQIARDAVQENRARATQELGRLSRQEREVAALLAGGLTNEAIAERLVLVPRTVSNHIVHILRKLNSRTWAVLQGLWPPEASESE
jgi:DNA-binding NarL/FixJ family response regulator